ncbi:unnamed protein product [Moneuplotes crassus]|uniref:Uncharacterized protein n=1 Tax=Euplotes crassus TaxID=5936 RepID=A0AAD1UAS6_EUPCR|nr:unnamed protein product [Moneuplotes crassus]
MDLKSNEKDAQESSDLSPIGEVEYERESPIVSHHSNTPSIDIRSDLSSETNILTNLFETKFDHESDSNSESPQNPKKMLTLPNISLKEGTKSRFMETLQLKLFQSENTVRQLVVSELKTFLKREEQYKFKLDKLYQDYHMFLKRFTEIEFVNDKGPLAVKISQVSSRLDDSELDRTQKESDLSENVANLKKDMGNCLINITRLIDTTNAYGRQLTDKINDTIDIKSNCENSYSDCLVRINQMKVDQERMIKENQENWENMQKTLNEEIEKISIMDADIQTAKSYYSKGQAIYKSLSERINSKCDVEYVNQETSKLKVLVDSKDSNVNVINRKMNMISNKVDKYDDIIKELQQKIENINLKSNISQEAKPSPSIPPLSSKIPEQKNLHRMASMNVHAGSFKRQKPNRKDYSNPYLQNPDIPEGESGSGDEKEDGFTDQSEVGSPLKRGEQRQKFTFKIQKAEESKNSIESESYCPDMSDSEERDLVKKTSQNNLEEIQELNEDKGEENAKEEEMSEDFFHEKDINNDQSDESYVTRKEEEKKEARQSEEGNKKEKEDKQEEKEDLKSNRNFRKGNIGEEKNFSEEVAKVHELQELKIKKKEDKQQSFKITPIVIPSPSTSSQNQPTKIEDFRQKNFLQISKPAKPKAPQISHLQDPKVTPVIKMSEIPNSSSESPTSSIKMMSPEERLVPEGVLLTQSNSIFKDKSNSPDNSGRPGRKYSYREVKLDFSSSSLRGSQEKPLGFFKHEMASFFEKFVAKKLDLKVNFEDFERIEKKVEDLCDKMRQVEEIGIFKLRDVVQNAPANEKRYNKLEGEMDKMYELANVYEAEVKRSRRDKSDQIKWNADSQQRFEDLDMRVEILSNTINKDIDTKIINLESFCKFQICLNNYPTNSTNNIYNSSSNVNIQVQKQHDPVSSTMKNFNKMSRINRGNKLSGGRPKTSKLGESTELIVNVPCSFQNPSNISEEIISEIDLNAEQIVMKYDKFKFDHKYFTKPEIMLKQEKCLGVFLDKNEFLTSQKRINNAHDLKNYFESQEEDSAEDRNDIFLVKEPYTRNLKNAQDLTHSVKPFPDISVHSMRQRSVEQVENTKHLLQINGREETKDHQFSNNDIKIFTKKKGKNKMNIAKNNQSAFKSRLNRLRNQTNSAERITNITAMTPSTDNNMLNTSMKRTNMNLKLQKLVIK